MTCCEMSVRPVEALQTFNLLCPSILATYLSLADQASSPIFFLYRKNPGELRALRRLIVTNGGSEYVDYRTHCIPEALTLIGGEDLMNSSKLVESLRLSVRDLLAVRNAGTGFQKNKPISFPSAYYLVYLIETILNHGLKGV